jgi:hypothetical protein
MGLLNHLFGSKKSIAKELKKDEQDKLWTLFEKQVSNYKKKEELCKHFSYGNVDKALKNFNATKRTLRRIRALIFSELVSISDEEKLEKEILEDLEGLKGKDEIKDLSLVIVTEEGRKEKLHELFNEIHNVLMIELHLIRVILENPLNVRNLLLHLFRLIYHREEHLYEVFRKGAYSTQSRHLHKEICRIAKAVIFQEEVEELKETDEDKFARSMFKYMGKTESQHSYRVLGEAIFDKLAEMAGLPSSRKEDVTECLERMEELMKYNKVLFKIIKKLRPKYSDMKIVAARRAFRKSFDMGAFEGFVADS